MPAPYNKYNVQINHTDSYTLTEHDHTVMIQNGLTPGIEADETAFLKDFLRKFPDVFIGKFMVRETAYNRPTEFPPTSVTITKAVV